MLQGFRTDDGAIWWPLKVLGATWPHLNGQRLAARLLLRYTIVMDSRFWMEACRTEVSYEGIKNARAGATTPWELTYMTAATNPDGGQSSTYDEQTPAMTPQDESGQPTTTSGTATAEDPIAAFEAL